MITKSHDKTWLISRVNMIKFTRIGRGIPKYAKYVKDIIANESSLDEFETVALTEECNSRILNKTKLPLNERILEASLFK